MDGYWPALTATLVHAVLRECAPLRGAPISAPMPGPARYSWFCPDHASRARFLTMHARMVRVAQLTGALLVVSLLPGLKGAPDPWLAVATIAVGFIQYATMQAYVPRLARPEVMVFVSFLILQVFVTAGVLFAGRVDDGGLAVLLWPVVGFATRLPTRAVVPCTAWTALLMIVAWLITDAGGIAADPAPLTVALALVVSLAALVTTLRNSDMANHSAAIFDPLTGIRNRSALEQRVGELEGNHQGVAVVVLDIDHFKAVNDRYGHDTGDQVLCALAATLDEHLRPGDELYRLGGEEFVAVLPGTSADGARAAAERLTGAVRSRPHSGCDITISAGVAAVPPGTEFTWRRAYRRADAALYAAKEGGRDQVRVAGVTGLPAADAVA